MKSGVCGSREEQIFIEHLSDLASRSEQHGYSTFSDFLSLNEQSLFHENIVRFGDCSYSLFGGCVDAERQMIQFYPDYCEAAVFPIVCICIQPRSEKFSEQLSHRDFLGAILNLGIDRAKTGDIFIQDHTAYLFCRDSISEFICDHLETVRHTKVKAAVCDPPDTLLHPELKTRQGTVTSIRIDSIIALAFNLSRAQASRYISQKLVFINGRLSDSASRVPKDGDIISIRGLGRFKLELTPQKSRKDKYIIKTHIYV